MADIVGVSPSGKNLSVEVKGLTKPNWWIIGKEVEPRDDLFYVFVHMPEGVQQQPEFFVMGSREVKEEMDKELEKVKAKGRKPTELSYCLSWKAVTKHKDRWDKLPQ